MNWLNVLLGPVTDAFNRWRDRKHEITMKKHELQVTKVEAEMTVLVSEAQARQRMLAERQTADVNWELESIRNSGWRDEYVTVLFTLPAVAIFIPYIQDEIERGFRYLESTPIWYQMVLMAIVGSALGIRVWDSFIKPLGFGKKTKAAE